MNQRMSLPLYPLIFRPTYKDYFWGGDRIIRHFGRHEPPGVYAESWEISDRPEGLSRVLNGPLKDKGLDELIKIYGTALLGSASEGPSFPLLIKLLDAKQTLSVQVHPDDQAAAQYGGEAKSEMWVVLAADEGAFVYAGWKPGVDEAAFHRAIAANEIDSLLNKIEVEVGDALYMPGGRVHAIGPGCLLLEVQQNSNTTYRVYDWGRVGPDGQPRDLHLEQAGQVMRWTDEASPKIPAKRLDGLGENTRWEVLESPYFRMERLEVREGWPCTQDGHSFHHLFPTDAPLRLRWDEDECEVAAGVSVLIPAGLAGYTLEPVESACTVLRTSLPENQGANP